jgi:hypothetical protein
MNRLNLLNGLVGLGFFSFLDQTLRNFLFTRSLIAAVVLAVGSRLLQGTRFSWLFPG